MRKHSVPLAQVLDKFLLTTLITSSLKKSWNEPANTATSTVVQYKKGFFAVSPEQQQLQQQQQQLTNFYRCSRWKNYRVNGVFRSWSTKQLNLAQLEIKTYTNLYEK